MSVSSASTIKSQCMLAEKSECKCIIQDLNDVAIADASLEHGLSLKRNSNTTYVKQKEQMMLNKLRKNFSEKIRRDQLNTSMALNITGRISHETLVLDWFKNYPHEDLSSKLYLIEEVLPCLVMALEQLLTNVHRRGEANVEKLCVEFNPINFLARHLMRNNPRYSNFSETSPYVRGLKLVLDELKNDLILPGQPNSLKELKAEAKKRRYQREKAQKKEEYEKKRRLISVVKQYEDWTDRLIDSNGDPLDKVDVALVQNSLRSFLEIVINYPYKLLDKASNTHSSKKAAEKLLAEFEPTDESGKMMTVRQYAEYMKRFSDELNNSLFNELLSHLTCCAKDFRTRMQFESRRILLNEVFANCDNSCVGQLDRHRILCLFEEFYDKTLNLRQREMVRNPRKWPVIEVNEEEWVSDSEDESQTQDPKFYNNNKDVTNLTKKLKNMLKRMRKGSKSNDMVNDNLIKAIKDLMIRIKSGLICDKQMLAVIKHSLTQVNVKRRSTVNAGLEHIQNVRRAVDFARYLADSQLSPPPTTTKRNHKPRPQKPRPQVSTTSGHRGVKKDAAANKRDRRAASKKPATSTYANTTDEMKVHDDKPDDDRCASVFTTGSRQCVGKGGLNGAIQSTLCHQFLQREYADFCKASNHDYIADEYKNGEGCEVVLDEIDNRKRYNSSCIESEFSLEGEQIYFPVDKTNYRDYDKAYANHNSALKNNDLNELFDKNKYYKKWIHRRILKKKMMIYDRFIQRIITIEKLLINKSYDWKTVQKYNPYKFDDFHKLDLEDSPIVKIAKTSVLTSHGSRSQSQASAFDADILNVSQFVQLVETFLGDSVIQMTCKASNSAVSVSVFDKLVDFISSGYVETETEKLARMAKTRNELRSAKQKTLLNSLFEMWDNEGCGQLAFDEVTSVMMKYKDTMESEAIQYGVVNIKKKNALSGDNRISKHDFRNFVYDVVSNMNGTDEFDYFVDYLLSNVERSYAERVRGEARKQWLQNIINAAKTSASSMQPIYKSLFQVLYKDTEAHGGNKEISAYISLLEKQEDSPMLSLRYVACTTFDAQYVLGKAMNNTGKGLSFQCLETGKPIHVPKLSPHNNIHFWNTDRPQEDISGSLILLPIKDKSRKTFGVLGVDTMNDNQSRGLFITHEIQFYQGVCQAFSIAYHQNITKQKAMRISESAIAWIKRRSCHISQITVYIVEPEGPSAGSKKNLTSANNFVLRRMMETIDKGPVHLIKSPPRLNRRDNLFRDYLFKCVDNSEIVSADAYGERHLAIPMRDHQGWATIIIDISIKGTKELPRNESRDTSKMLRLLQIAYKEIYREASEGPTDYKLEGEKEGDDQRTGIIFDRLMLLELRENVRKLDSTAYAEMKSYQVPPVVIHLILKAVLSIFYHSAAIDGDLDCWTTCKQYVKSGLSQMIINYDPTIREDAINTVPLELINSYLDEVPHGTVNKHGSKPAELLYNWAFVCVSLIEHTRKMNAGRPHVIADQVRNKRQPLEKINITKEEEPGQTDANLAKKPVEPAAGEDGGAADVPKPLEQMDPSTNPVIDNNEAGQDGENVPKEQDDENANDGDNNEPIEKEDTKPTDEEGKEGIELVKEKSDEIIANESLLPDTDGVPI